MKLVKVLLGSVLAGVIVSIIGTVGEYVTMGEPGGHYFSFLGSVMWGAIYMVPLTTSAGMISFIIFLILKKLNWLKRPFLNAVVSVLLPVLVFVAVIPLFINQEETDNLYLIPEGYEGEVYTFYNVKGAPPVKSEDGYRVHPINKEGYYVTSTEELSTGLVTDHYFFVDDKGKRTPINKNCIRGFGVGGHQTSLNEVVDLQYTGFEVSSDECSEEFRVTGNGMGERQDQLIWEILKKYYGIDGHW